MERVRSKVCKDCTRRKPIKSFYAKGRSERGARYFSRCKPCHGAMIAERRKTLKKNPSTSAPWAKLGRRAAILRKSARAAVNMAVWRGKIRKPIRCNECGGKKILEGHHHRGYERKLDVVWLCRDCHRERHVA